MKMIENTLTSIEIDNMYFLINKMFYNGIRQIALVLIYLTITIIQSIN